jgi:hypothetical protein
MATQYVHDDRNLKTSRTVGTGSVLELICAAGAAVLCIIGLAGGVPMWLTAIATIVLGVALLIEGGGFVARHHRYFSQYGGSESMSVSESSRTSAESIAGIAGIVLGVLSLIGLAPHMLMPISLIIFGGGLLMGTGMSGGLSGTGHALVGCAAVVLGILALVGVTPVTLTLVGLLAVSGALFISAFASGTRFMGHHGPIHAHG